MPPSDGSLFSDSLMSAFAAVSSIGRTHWPLSTTSPARHVASGRHTPMPELNVVPVAHTLSIGWQVPPENAVFAPHTVSVVTHEPLFASSCVLAPHAVAATTHWPSVYCVPAPHARSEGMQMLPCAVVSPPQVSAVFGMHLPAATSNVRPVPHADAVGAHLPVFASSCVPAPQPDVSTTHLPFEALVPSPHTASVTH